MSPKLLVAKASGARILPAALSRIHSARYHRKYIISTKSINAPGGIARMPKGPRKPITRLISNGIIIIIPIVSRQGMQIGYRNISINHL